MIQALFYVERMLKNGTYVKVVVILNPEISSVPEDCMSVEPTTGITGSAETVSWNDTKVLLETSDPYLYQLIDVGLRKAIRDKRARKLRSAASMSVHDLQILLTKKLGSRHQEPA